VAAPAERPPYGVAAVVTALVGAIYVVTIAPTTQFWDTAEYISSAKVLGIPHPPGNSLFVLLAHVWGYLPLAASYALRLNLFAATTSALASGLLFLVTERLLRDVSPAPRWTRRVIAAAGVLVGATSFTVWNQSTVNEKVYTLSLLSIALVLWLAVHWGDAPAGERRDRQLVLIVYLLALSATNHLMGLLVIPAVLVYVWHTDRAVLVREPVLLAMVGAIIVGVSVWLFLPLRAAHFPAINEGEPTTWAALKAVLSREQYAKPPLFQRQAPLGAQLANYWQYFSWQFGHDWPERIRQAVAVVFLLIGLLGGVRQWMRDRRGALAMTALMVTVTLALIFYLNFKYGYSMNREQANLPREVRERDYFFIVSFLLWGIWVGLGLAAVLEWTGKLLDRHPERSEGWRLSLPLLAVALVPLAGNHVTASRRGEMLPRDFAVDMLQSVEPYGILITAGDNDTFPLWYAQEVEGVRPDVLLANQSLMNTTWHLKQLNRRPIVDFDSLTASPIYRGRSWTKPAKEPLALSFAAIDSLPPGYRLPQSYAFQVGKVRATLAAGILERSDFITLQLIRDNLGTRPIYFSRTVGNYPDRMGLTPYLEGQGLVRKLLPDSLGPSDSTAFMAGLGWIELSRTRELMFEVYHHESAARSRPRGWTDLPSEGILSLYWVVYAAWAEIVKSQLIDASKTKLKSDSAFVASGPAAEQIAKRILVNTSFGRQRSATR
jgi:hypothetical protein